MGILVGGAPPGLLVRLLNPSLILGLGKNGPVAEGFVLYSADQLTVGKKNSTHQERKASGDELFLCQSRFLTKREPD